MNAWSVAGLFSDRIQLYSLRRTGLLLGATCFPATLQAVNERACLLVVEPLSNTKRLPAKLRATVSDQRDERVDAYRYIGRTAEQSLLEQC